MIGKIPNLFSNRRIMTCALLPHGDMPHGDAPLVTGIPERTARQVLSRLIDPGPTQCLQSRIASWLQHRYRSQKTSGGLSEGPPESTPFAET